MTRTEHRDLMREALARETEAQRALLDGDEEAARAGFLAAAELYRESWRAAPPGSYGRLVGMLKASVLGGEGRTAAIRARAALAEAAGSGAGAGGSPTAAYARALAALISGEDDDALVHAELMRAGSPAFDRAADAIAALARRDGAAYEAALAAIVRDFERRTDHLTGVAIADTAVMLQRIAAERGLRAALESDLLPSGSG